MIRRIRRTTRHRLLTLAAALGIGTASAAALTMTSLADPPPPSAPASAPEAPAAPPTAPGELPSERPEEPVAPLDPRLDLGLDPSKFELDGDHYVQRLEDGRVVHLTLVPQVQEAVADHIDLRKPPHAGLVAVEPATGRVLALVSRSNDTHKPVDNYALRAQAPAASVFKMVTAAALLDIARIDPKKPVCYSGGVSHLTEEEIRGNPSKDTSCSDLADAIGGSLNVVIARLALNHLSRQDLEEMALRFGFNREIPFELPVEVSEATFVEDDIERARTAAGFWNVNLSSLHGALISAAIANDGVMMRPTLVDWIENPDGSEAWRSTPEPWLTVMTANNARQLQQMGVRTTTDGTARRVFQSDHFPKSLSVSGKTGTLSNKRPYRLFTWFVGSAPADAANIAVGAIVANPEKWWIKGTHTSATAIKTYQSVLERRASAATEAASAEQPSP